MKRKGLNQRFGQIDRQILLLLSLLNRKSSLSLKNFKNVTPLVTK